MKIVVRYFFTLAILILPPLLLGAVEFENVSFYSNLNKYSLFEVKFDLSRTYSNPYDPNVIKVDGLVIRPGGDTLKIPCFYYQGFKVNYGKPETYDSVGLPQWRMRYTPIEPGNHYLILKAVDKSGTYTDIIREFAIEKYLDPGFISRDPLNALSLLFDNKSTYIPIGHNVCWDDGSGIGFYDYYFGKMGQVGENWTRVWMTPFAKLALEWSTGYESGYYEGLGRYAQEVAFKIDSIVAFAERENLYMQMCIHSYNELSLWEHGIWRENPYNASNGGMLHSPEEFFTDEKAKTLSKKKYRYIVARWGYSTHILAWEFWNEVDITYKYDPSPVASWHKEMACYVNSIDENDHLVTTSSSRSGDSLYWSLPEIDIIQIHRYGSGIAEALPKQIRTMQRFGKPVIVGEYSSDSWKPGDTFDSAGVQLHKGIWSSFMAESGGMMWWWDSYIEKHKLYQHFKPLASYIKGENFSSRSFKTKPDIILSGGPTDTIISLFPGLDWSASLTDSFEIQSDGTAAGTEKLSSFIQGWSHTDMGRRAVFVVNATRKGNIGVDIKQVSTNANARLQIFLDFSASPILDKALSPGDEGIYRIPISPGLHHIKVYNAGEDWFSVKQYIFTCMDVSITRVQGLTDDSGGYFWFYDRNHLTGTPGSGVNSGVSAIVKRLSPGSYNVEFWNTYPPGGILEDTSITSKSDSLIFRVPYFTYDIAAKIVRAIPQR